MNKNQLIVNWVIIILLVVIILQLRRIYYVVDNIDWDVRNILGKLNR